MQAKSLFEISSCKQDFLRRIIENVAERLLGTPWKTRVYEWYKDFKNYLTVVEDLPVSRRSLTTNTEENIEKKKTIVLRKAQLIVVDILG